MKVSASSAVVSLALWLNVATALPHDGMRSRCQSESVASQIACGDTTTVKDCIAHTGSHESRLRDCLVGAGCTQEQAHAEAARASRRCQGGEESGDRVEEVVVELREVQPLENRQDDSSSTAATSATTTATSSAETSTSATSDSATSTSEATSTTSASSSTTTASSTDSTSSATSTAASSSSSSATTSSSTSSSTASSTSASSTASSTSSSTPSSSIDAFGPWGYIIAAVLSTFTAVCMGCILWKLCAERSARKKAAKLAEEKEALALLKN